MSKSIINESLDEYRAYLNGEPNQVEVNTYTIPQKISLDDLHLTEALKKSLTKKQELKNQKTHYFNVQKRVVRLFFRAKEKTRQLPRFFFIQRVLAILLTKNISQSLQP